ncbi:MAG: ATP-binding protein [Crenarchaeota archaeon]|nr:ATP-binding protein [Thermoproteota archaeon]
MKRGEQYYLRYLIYAGQDLAEIEFSYIHNGVEGEYTIQIMLETSSEFSKIREQYKNIIEDLERKLSNSIGLHILPGFFEKMFILLVMLERSSSHISSSAERFGKQLPLSLPIVKEKLYILVRNSLQNMYNMHLVALIDRRLESSSNVLPSYSNVLFLDSRLFLYSTFLAQAIDILTKNEPETFYRLIRQFRELVKRQFKIVDIRLGLEGIPYIYTEGGNPIPYTLFGDGFKLAIFETFVMHLIKNGIIILEEPETHMHPELMSLFMDQLVDLIYRNNIQLFITTHSIELVSYILKSVAEIRDTNTLRQDVRILRMREHRIKDILNGEEARTKLEEICQDLREV